MNISWATPLQNDNSWGASGGGYMEVSARFRADMLDPLAPGSLVGLRVYIGGTTYPAITVKIYGPGSDSGPGAELWSEDVMVAPSSWNAISLSNQFAFTSGAEFWVGYIAHNDISQFPCGSGPGNNVNADWYRTGTVLPLVSAWAHWVPAPTICWNIEAVVSSTRGPDRILAPAERGTRPVSMPAGVASAH